MRDRYDSCQATATPPSASPARRSPAPMGKGGRAIKNALEESRSATPAKESAIASDVELLQKAFDRMIQGALLHYSAILQKGFCRMLMNAKMRRNGSSAPHS